jgi:hypothetical protein
MLLSFRQGIIRYQTVGPPLLSKTPLNPSTVDLNVVPGQPVLVTFAHYAANYVIAENTSISSAWGNGSTSYNGPLPAGTTVYLFWDINIATGALSRGWTQYAPIYSSSAPPSPMPGQMWYDNINNVFNVWTVYGHAAGVWVNCIRVFAGTYYNNATLAVDIPGSQVQPSPGIIGNFQGGNIILGTNSVPLRNQDGTFINTTSQLIISNTSGQNVQFEAALSFGMASEPIGAYYLVTIGQNLTISLASCLNYSLFVNGIVTQPLNANDVGQIITSGIVTNPNWSWDQSSIGAPLFCDPTGAVTLTPPNIGVVQQIGTVYSTTAIILNIGPAVRIRT